MNLIKNKFIIIFVFLFFFGCSFDSKTGIWKQEKSSLQNFNTKEILKDEKNLIKEINPNIKIKITSNSFSQTFIGNLNNNNERINYNGELKTLKKYKFSNIKNFEKLESEIIVNNDSVIFFDNKGTLLKYGNDTKLVWKKNLYNKSEKKLGPILSMSLKDNILIIVDNLARFYAIDIRKGDLLWEKRNSSPFNSQVKIFDDKFYAVDYQNTLRSFSIKTGNELWNVKTENSFIKSKKKLSVVIGNNKIFFNNYIGDVGSVDISSGELIWQTPTQKSSIYEDSFFLETSDIVLNNNEIFLSNNKNEFFSINQKNGFVNWITKINS
ncbi:MAG: PQQ-binding-like beta-propeller repeat protein, partial [Candidatus Pelagibacter sp.]